MFIRVLVLILTSISIFGCVSAITRSVQAGKTEEVVKALDSGTSVDYVDDNADGYSLLDTAMKYKRYDLARVLLERGAKCDHKENQYVIPTYNHFTTGTPLELVPLFKRNECNLNTLLNYAIILKNVQLVEALLQDGVTPNRKNAETVASDLIIVRDAGSLYVNSSDPEMRAVPENSRQIFLKLKQAGINFQYLELSTASPLLSVLCESDNTDVLKILLENGVSWNIHISGSKYSLNWLHVALAREDSMFPSYEVRPSQVRYLINYARQKDTSKGKSKFYEWLNSQDKNGNTALHYAAIKQNAGVYNVLAANGANENISNDAQQTAAMLYQSIQQAKRAKAEREAEESRERSNLLGKIVTIGAGAAAINSMSGVSEEFKGKAMVGFAKDVGQSGTMQGVQNFNQNLSNHASSVTAQSGGTSKVGNSKGSNSDDFAKDIEIKSKACANNYNGPNSDPQFDSFCKLAAFNACLHRDLGVVDHDAQGRKACQSLSGLIKSTHSTNYKCSYCPYPY